MSAKSLIFLSITCVFMFSIGQAVGQWPNPGRMLDCWVKKLYFDKFEIKAFFSSRDRRDKQLLATSKFESDDIDFDPRRRTTILVHGLQSNAHEYAMNALRDTLLIWEDMNVIVLDWNAGCNNYLLYHKAAANTEFVALNIRELITSFRNFFKTQRGINPEEWGPLHFIGHSLGAHVVGQAAALLKQVGITVDRVTGLDPAEPCFENEGMPLRLSRDSAAFVDVIHTDAATSKNEAFGLRDAIGHADYYVNGGNAQFGCSSTRPNTKRTLNYDKLFWHSLGNGSCHHGRAPLLFIQSLLQTIKNQCKFWAYPWSLDKTPAATHKILQKSCDESRCVEMGIRAENYNYPNNRNIYYVPTSAKAPFCDV